MASNNQDESAKTIGNRDEDTHTSNTLYGKVYTLEEHEHNVTMVLPSLGDGITLTGGAGAWQEGSFIEIDDGSSFTDSFDIHFVNLMDASGTDEYQIDLYQGALGSESLIAQARTIREANQSSIPPIPVKTPVMVTGTRISAKMASKAGGSKTIDIAISYHFY